MKKLFKKLLVPLHLEYLIVGPDLIILETSSDVHKFADCPDQVFPGQDVRSGFPELIGTEDILMAVLQGEQESFEFKGIGRFPEHGPPLYMDFYVNHYRDEETYESWLIILFQDVSDRMSLEQRLVQSTNETALLLSALSASKDSLNKIITSMADALIVTTKKGTIKAVNKAAQKLFCYSEDELKGRPISMLVADSNFFNLVTEGDILSEGDLTDIEVVCQTQKGKKLSVEFSCSAIETDLEDLQHFIYIGRDITHRVRAQQRMLAQSATAQILSESPTLKEAAPKILLALCESLGLALGELWMVEGSQSQKEIQNPKLLRCAEIWSRPAAGVAEYTAFAKQLAFAPGEGLPGLVWATNSPQWIVDVASEANFLRREVTAKLGLHAALGFPIISDSEVLGVMIFFSRQAQSPDEDLIEMMAYLGSQLGQFIKRKQAEAALAESEERYRDLFENASDLIQSVAPNGRFLYVNRAWRETLGYSEAEVADLTVLDIIHPNSQAYCLQIFDRLIAGEKLGAVKAELITKAGQTISVEGSINCKFVEGKQVAIRSMFRDITQRLQAEEALRHQQEKTERLLLNILPEPIADRLKQKPSTIAEDFAEVTVLFADIVGFTQLASYLSPIQLVNLLNEIFSAFDWLTEKYSLEKIKTIGDAYMVVGGMPVRRQDHAHAIAEMALDMQAEIARFNAKNNLAFSIRTGIHSGPVVAGVIGIKKFIYDLWGDTVNTASRMESHGLAGRIQVSDATYQLLREHYLLEKRGAIQVKGKGEMTTYFLLGRKECDKAKSPDIQTQNSLQRVRESTQRLIELIDDKLKDI
ncbi:adenylate/guanylate cyclase domain-containing protein [Kamptonema formosum]|uniref:adenylate/guanylate cyclase domain-containing protein n=1 Tax=Kamptonema formosum TaxID=331992 RepID=UPI000345E0F9|nr:adenylate/guanylate cyclase domain-containing protein [Oscillatoria sp. PCC 10802]